METSNTLTPNQMILLAQQVQSSNSHGWPRVEVVQKLPEAELPVENGIGHTITVVGRTENRTEDLTNQVNDFTTGLCFNPPEGYHIEVTATPQLYKQGYELSGGTFFIKHSDSSNGNGVLIIPLFKFSENENDLDLPFEAVQMRLCRSIPYYIINPSISKARKTEESPDRRTTQRNTFKAPVRAGRQKRSGMA